MVPQCLWRPGLRGLAAGAAGLGLACLILGLALPSVGAQQSGKTTVPAIRPAGKAAVPAAAQADGKTTATVKTKKQLEAEEALADPFAAEHPQIILDGLQCQMHRDGKVLQEIRAKTGRYDEAANILELRQLNVKYLDKGTTTVGQVTCGSGRVWTTDFPDQGINAHDMLLQQNVLLQTRDHLMLQAPEMRYNALASVISSNMGFTQQLPAGRSYLIGKGQRFELKLILEANEFEYWKAYGNPSVVMQKSEKPVFKP